MGWRSIGIMTAYLVLLARAATAQELPSTAGSGLILRLSDLPPVESPSAYVMQELPAPAGEPSNENADEGKAGDDDPNQDETSRSQSSRRSRRRPRFDPQLVERGRVAFEESCTVCHDAERALSKRKSRTAWLATVRRMARMDDADIASSDIAPIATYLASLSAPPDTQGDQSDGDSSDEEGDRGNDSEGEQDEDFADDIDAALEEAAEFGPGLNISTTIAPLWRGGNDNLENPDFFADVWVRMDWQPDGPLRARVTTCTSCHSDANGDSGFTLELVEGTVHYDLMHAFREKHPLPEDCEPRIEAEVKAGRFVVPFGAFHAMTHPGIYRTLTVPLMYNMGRQVNPDPARPPVLPMPYSDEGVDLHASYQLPRDWKINVDTFAVNGLQAGGAGVRFTNSRSYADNNQQPAYGGRATIGNKQMRFGGSVMAGRMEDDMDAPLNYHFAGADATARFCDDQIRIYFEYALRRNDTRFPVRQIAYGTVTELEVLLLSDPNVSALARYDTLEHRDFAGQTSIERFTWGLSTTAIAGSLLIVNHEHWNFPADVSPDVDVLGIRWVATF